MGWKDYIPFLPKDTSAEKPKLKMCCACPETKVGGAVQQPAFWSHRHSLIFSMLAGSKG